MPTDQTASTTTNQSSAAGSMPLPSGADPMANAQQGIQLIQRLLDEQRALSAQTVGAVQQAVTPVAGRGTATPNIGTAPSFGAVPLITTPTYSRSATRSKGIANIVLGAVGLIGQVEKKQKEKEQQDLAVHIENVLKYTDGINTAQTVLQSDPNNVQAKQVLEQNQKNLDALLSDPKMRKKIAKAFDINFTDPTQNNQPEHGALNKAAQSYSQQLVQKMPAQLVPNQVAQQKLQVLDAKQKAIDDQIKAVAPVVGRQISAVAGLAKQQMHETSEADIKAADREAANQRELSREQNQQQVEAQKDAEAFKRATTVAAMTQNGAMARQLQRDKDAYKRAMDTVTVRATAAAGLGDTDPKKQAMYRSNLTVLNNALKSNDDAIAKDKVLMADKNIYPDHKTALQADIDWRLRMSGKFYQQIDDLTNKLGAVTDTKQQIQQKQQTIVNGPQDDSSNTDTDTDTQSEAEQDKEDDTVIDNQ